MFTEAPKMEMAEMGFESGSTRVHSRTLLSGRS